MTRAESPSAAPAPEPANIVDRLIQRGENATLTDAELEAARIDEAIAAVRTRNAADRLHLRDAIDAWKRRNVQRQNVHGQLDRLRAVTEVNGASTAAVRVRDAVDNQIDALRDPRTSSANRTRAYAAVLAPFMALGGFIGAGLLRRSQRPVMEEVPSDPNNPNSPRVQRPKMEPDPANPGQQRQVMEANRFGRILQAIGIAGLVTTLAGWGSAVAVARDQRNANVAEGPAPRTAPRANPRPTQQPPTGGAPRPTV